MKISNKRELKQISFYQSSDIDFKDLMNLYENVDATCPSDNPLCFRKNLVERL